MTDSWFPAANFNVLSNDSFDDVLKILDFPLEDVEANDDGEDWNAGLQNFQPPSGFSISDFGDQKSFPGLLSASSEALLNSKSSVLQASSFRKLEKLLRSASQVSVLQTSSISPSPVPNPSRLALPVKRPRSQLKRSTRLIFNLPFESETFCPENPYKKKLRKKPKSMKPVSGFFSETTKRKCSHCEATRTPQWREGPNGAKTLCNACGVRFKSGRLVLEYRPALSPTFVSSLHSNSHQKIIEMRKKAGRQLDYSMTQSVLSTA